MVGKVSSDNNQTYELQNHISELVDIQLIEETKQEQISKLLHQIGEKSPQKINEEDESECQSNQSDCDIELEENSKKQRKLSMTDDENQELNELNLKKQQISSQDLGKEEEKLDINESNNNMSKNQENQMKIETDNKNEDKFSDLKQQKKNMLIPYLDSFYYYKKRNKTQVELKHFEQTKKQTNISNYFQKKL